MLEPNTYFRTEEVNVSIFLQILSSLKLFDSSDGGSKCLGILIKKRHLPEHFTQRRKNVASSNHRGTKRI